MDVTQHEPRLSPGQVRPTSSALDDRTIVQEFEIGAMAGWSPDPEDSDCRDGCSCGSQESSDLYAARHVAALAEKVTRRESAAEIASLVAELRSARQFIVDEIGQGATVTALDVVLDRYPLPAGAGPE